MLQDELAPIRERRKQWEAPLPELYEILNKGTENARTVAAQTMHDVRAAMKINYFE